MIKLESTTKATLSRGSDPAKAGVLPNRTVRLCSEHKLGLFQSKGLALIILLIKLPNKY